MNVIFRPATIAAAVATVMTLTVVPAAAQVSASMTKQIPGAKFVPAYTTVQRAHALQQAMKLPAPPILDAMTSLTPNVSYAPDGSHLSFWKPSYVIGTASGGEAGVNFWGIYNQGHVNVGYAQRAAKPYVLDCRMISVGNIAYKVYSGESAQPSAESRMSLRDGHFLLTVLPAGAGEQVSVELWPATPTTPVGFFGCELGTYH